SNHVEAAGISNTIITSDYPNRLREVTEAAWPGSVTVFFPGMVGGLMTPLDVEVILEDGTPTRANTIEKADRLGELLGAMVIDAFAAPGVVRDDDPIIGVRRHIFPHQIANLALQILGAEGVVQRRGYDADGDLLSQDQQASPAVDVFVMSEVDVVDLGPVQIATIPGELYPELGVRDANGQPGYQDPIDPGADFPDATHEPLVVDLMDDVPFKWIMGLANDFTGYILPITQWDAVAP